MKKEMKGLEMNDSGEFTISRSSWTPERKDLVQNLIPAEKPLVSMRFSRRRAIKSSPEARQVLGVSKPKQRQHNTLESMWGTQLRNIVQFGF